MFIELIQTVYAETRKVKSVSMEYNWASVSKPHTSVFSGQFVSAYGVRACVRPHTAYRFRVSI